MDKDLNILVVDDDEKIGKLFTDVFKDEGYAVHPVYTGEDAVKTYQDKPFNIVFLDMILPGMSGLETLKALKGLDANVRVVLMTGYSILGMLENATRVGIITTLMKPFHIDQMKKAIGQSVQESPAPVEGRTYNALIVDERIGLSEKLKNLFEDMKCEIHTCRSPNDIIKMTKTKEYDLILISSMMFEKNVMETFYSIRESMPASNNVMLVDEHMDIDEIRNTIMEIFQKA